MRVYELGGEICIGANDDGGVVGLSDVDEVCLKMLFVDKSSRMVEVGLNSLDDSEFSIFAAGSMFVAVPIIALYAVLSKYLIQGGSAGAVKE